jgi:hypothetical protein
VPATPVFADQVEELRRAALEAPPLDRLATLTRRVVVRLARERGNQSRERWWNSDRELEQIGRLRDARAVKARKDGERRVVRERAKQARIEERQQTLERYREEKRAAGRNAANTAERASTRP